MQQSTQIVQLVVNSWNQQNKRVDQMIEKLSDEQWLQQVAPGKNRGIYLLGHLTAVNDALLPLFGLGDRLFPELEALFIRQPDGAAAEYPSVSDLKSKWKTVNEKLAMHFGAMSVEDWLNRHTAVSEEDFAREPHRNKLNVLLSRSTHQSYHIGQLVWL